jgi:hypothetical protein
VPVLLAVLATGCAAATEHRVPASPDATAHHGATTAVAHDQAARVDAVRIMAAFRPPAGARRIPIPAHPLMQVLGTPSGPDLIDNTTWWTVAGDPGQILDWVRAHGPRGGRIYSSGSAGDVGQPTVLGLVFAWPVPSGVWETRQLRVSAAPGGAGTLLRVDAVVWLPVKTSAYFVPLGAHSVTVSLSHGLTPQTRRYGPVTTTDPAVVRALVAAVNGLAIPPPGVFACPADDGSVMRLVFASAGGTQLARVAAEPTGCGDVTIRVGRMPSAGLSGGRGLVDLVESTMHLPWPHD